MNEDEGQYIQVEIRPGGVWRCVDFSEKKDDFKELVRKVVSKDKWIK